MKRKITKHTSFAGSCRRFAAGLALSTLCLTMAGCGSSSKDPTSSGEASSEVASTKAPTPETKPAPTKPVIPEQTTSAPTQTTAPVIDPGSMDFTPCNEVWYTTTKLNVRSAPSTEAKKITTLPADTAVHCTGIGNGWNRISINGADAYVSSQYLTRNVPGEPVTEPVTEPATEVETLPAIDPADPFLPMDDTCYTTRKLNLRTEPSESSTIIAVLPQDFAVHRVGVFGNWTRVEINGNLCYVATKYLTMSVPAAPTDPVVTPTQTPVVPTEAPTVAPTKPSTPNPPVTGQVTRLETENGILYTGNPGPLIAIDPGHQAKGNNDLEPVAPGSSEMKKKVSYGTSGVTTGMAESKLNLIVSIRIKDALLAQGYNVLMIREVQEVDISNAVRTVRSNASGAAVLIHVHANGSSNAEKRGAETLCPRTDNPYMTTDNIAKSRTLAMTIINSVCARTGMPNLGLYSTNAMTGINWSNIPVTTIEMGYMSNPTDDALMITPDFQEKLAAGVCDGLNQYFGR